MTTFYCSDSAFNLAIFPGTHSVAKMSAQGIKRIWWPLFTDTEGKHPFFWVCLPKQHLVLSTRWKGHFLHPRFPVYNSSHMFLHIRHRIVENVIHMSLFYPKKIPARTPVSSKTSEFSQHLRKVNFVFHLIYWRPHWEWDLQIPSVGKIPYLYPKISTFSFKEMRTKIE